MDSGAVECTGTFPPCGILGTKQLRMFYYRMLMRALNACHWIKQK